MTRPGGDGVTGEGEMPPETLIVKELTKVEVGSAVLAVMRLGASVLLSIYRGRGRNPCIFVLVINTKARKQVYIYACVCV